MELLRENILDLIRNSCSSHLELNVFNGHIIVNLPDAEKDFRSIYNKVKQEIKKCIRQHFPDRDEELLFEIRNCSWNCSFKLGKTTL